MFIGTPCRIISLNTSVVPSRTILCYWCRCCTVKDRFSFNLNNELYLIFVYHCFNVLFQKYFTPKIVNVDKHWLVYKETSSWADIYIIAPFLFFRTISPWRLNQKHFFNRVAQFSAIERGGCRGDKAIIAEKILGFRLYNWEFFDLKKLLTRFHWDFFWKFLNPFPSISVTVYI